MAKEQIKSKEAKMRAAMAGGKGKRKKWNKGKAREKLNNLVLFDQKTYERLGQEIPKMKLITTATVSERLKINGALARASILELTKQGLLKPLVHSRSQWIYTRATH